MTTGKSSGYQGSAGLILYIPQTPVIIGHSMQTMHAIVALYRTDYIYEQFIQQVIHCNIPVYLKMIIKYLFMSFYQSHVCV